MLRLSVVYATLDLSRIVERRHLESALAIWRYCEDSARYIFGTATGDPLADRILDFVREAGSVGISRTELTGKLGRNQEAGRRDVAVQQLANQHVIIQRTEQTTGRPAVRLFAT